MYQFKAVSVCPGISYSSGGGSSAAAAAFLLFLKSLFFSGFYSFSKVDLEMKKKKKRNHVLGLCQNLKYFTW
jgi:hypothetical protein